MIILKIEERDNEEISLKFNEIDTSTDLEKAVLSSILEVVYNDSEFVKNKE